MNRQYVRTGFDEGRDVPIGFRYHQMHIQWKPGDLPDRLDHRCADRDIRHEMAIHHVDMEHVSAGFLHFPDLFAKRGEIRGKNRRSDPDHWLTSRRMMSFLETR